MVKNTKKILFAALLLSLCILCVCLVACDSTQISDTGTADVSDSTSDTAQTDGESVDARDVTVRSVYDIINGVEHKRGEHVDSVGNSVIELDFRSVEKMVSKDTGSSKTYYPRIKVLADGTYMLIYQDGRWGPNIYYKLSEDYVTWSEPKLLFERRAIDGDMKKFATADAVVMPDGEIIVVCTYLSENNYTTKNTYNGMALKRSKDNAQSWSEMEIIYGATNWEPDILLRSDGELQIYFTHTGPYIELYGYADKRSSGAAILRSYDNGKTWTPDVSSAPYEAWRVLQIPVGEYLGHPYFTGQMPVAVELHNGDTMVAVETQYLNAACYISLGYSKDNWKTPLGLTEAGPAELKEKLWGGVAPYLVQFDSGEVVLSYVTVTDGLMKLRVGSEDGRTFSAENSVFDGISTGLWSSIETLDDHTLGIVSDYQPTLSSGETMSFLTVSRGVLNHSFDATAGQSITVDGDNSDWKVGVEAIFVGSQSQAQSTVRVSEDTDNVYFVIDRLDTYLNEKDTLQLYVAGGADEYYKIELSAKGVSKIDKYSGGEFKTLSNDTVECATFIGGTLANDKDKDSGCVIELAIPKSALNISSECVYVNVIMNNTDKKETFAKDELVPTKMADRTTWVKVGVSK